MITYLYELPQKHAYYELYRTTGWSSRSALGEDGLYDALRGSWRVVSAYEGWRLVGSGRLVSDGSMQAFICDVVVEPDRQGRGIGRGIVEKLLAETEAAGIRTVGLFSAMGKAAFYRKLGFEERPAGSPGMVWQRKAADPSADGHPYPCPPQRLHETCG